MTMTLNTLTGGESWMTPDERELNHQLIRALAESLSVAGVQENALITLRVNDVAATWLLARRLESALTPTDAEPAPCPTPAQANAIGKCRERLRSAIKELEGCCTRTRAKSAPSLSDRIYETMRMLEDSLPLTETPPANTNSAQDSETPPNNPNSIDNPPVTPRQTPAQRDHNPQTSPTAPNTIPAPRRDDRPHENPRPHASQPADTRKDPIVCLTWTAPAKGPPK